MTTSILNFLEELKLQILLRYRNGLENISGHNGPYRDKETGVRTQAHLIALLSNLDRSKHSTNYKSLVDNLVANLLNSPHRLGKAVFNQRTKPGKDEVNGVIGLAWVIEALCCAYEVYQNDEAKLFLESVEEELDFNQRRGLWYRPVLKDNKYYKTLDETFNHQLWLAYALVFKSVVLGQELSSNLLRFFSLLDSNLNIYNSGLIKHAMHNSTGMKAKLKNSIRRLRDGYRIGVLGQSKKYKENGYHLFNIFAFARIKDLGYDKLLAHSTKVPKSLKYCSNVTLFDKLVENKDINDFYKIEPPSKLGLNRYGFPYNVSGFEMLYVNEVFQLGLSEEMKNRYWETQANCFGILAGNTKQELITEDEANLLLRTYELSFLAVIAGKK